MSAPAVVEVGGERLYRVLVGRDVLAELPPLLSGAAQVAVLYAGPLRRYADRVAAMSLQAYAEGAVPLATVLEAQRNGREALGRYIDDVAAANDAAAALRLATASGGEP